MFFWSKLSSTPIFFRDCFDSLHNQARLRTKRKYRLALLKGHVCHDPHLLETQVMTTELRTNSYMRKSRFATVWLISPSTSSSQKHYNHIDFSYQPFPKHTPTSFSSCTLLTLSPLSDLASFHLHLFKPTHPSRPSSMPPLYEISRSTQTEMSFLSTEQPQSSDYTCPMVLCTY